MTVTNVEPDVAALWDALVGALVIYAARRFLLPGDRTFAVYLGLYALGRFLTQALAIDYSPRVFGLRVDQVLMILILAGSVAYLYLTRNERGPDSISGTRNAGPSAADHEGVAGSGVASAGDTSNRVGDDALARGAAADPAVG